MLIVLGSDIASNRLYFCTRHDIDFSDVIELRISSCNCSTSCADPEGFARGGPTLMTFFFFFFLVDERREDPKGTKIGPSSARQRIAI